MGITPIIKQQKYPYPEGSAVPLAAYAQHIASCECSFFGVGQNIPDDLCRYANCRTVWTKDQRDWAQHYLAEAQFEIENVLNYHIGQRWITDERHGPKTPIITKRAYIVNPGVRTELDLGLAEAVDTSTDPGVVGPIVVDFTDESQVQVYHEGTDFPITPSAITISGVNLTIDLPRCRTVLPEYQDNPRSGLNYTDLTKFASSVDVKRVYNVNDEPVTVVHRTCADCEETTTTVCMYVRHALEGSIDYESCRCNPDYVKLNYFSGRAMIEDGRYTMFGREALDSVVRLAHVKMPKEPCECDPIREMWKADRVVAVDGRGRVLKGNTPFGPEEGAWVAWKFVNGPGMKLWKPGLL